jgi:GNAT superfamily N-acetyltransferase
MPILVRDYQKADASSAGRLIAETYRAYNLAFLPPEEQGAYLGPFQFADSTNEIHQRDIAQALQAEMVTVAENEKGEIVGILRGSKDRLHSLFVRGDMHHQGIGSRLVGHFEKSCLAMGGEVIRLASTLYAVPFYQKLGYKKSTGVRTGWSFAGENFKWQPMKKSLAATG